MSLKRIRQDLYERVLLTEVSPYETPINFSFWGAYNYAKNLASLPANEYLHKLLSNKKANSSIPYKYKIRKDSTSYRTLTLIHPKHSGEVVDFYKKYDVQIIKACEKSQFSLRAPHLIARCYHGGLTDNSSPEEIEDLSARTAYASSYFTYRSYSHIYKFFDSDQFTELEKSFPSMLHLDVGKCFPSIYTHTISWALKGKGLAKNLLHLKAAKDAYRNHAPFDVAFDRLIQNMSHAETHGIPIGPELCRIFAEIIFQHIDNRIETQMAAKGFIIDKHYSALRYIDDYFLFFKSQSTADVFTGIVATELEKFKLHINESKTSLKHRPFLSDRSALKIQLSEYISEIAKAGSAGARIKSSKELNKVRLILKGSSTGIIGASSFFHKSISNILFAAPGGDSQKLFNIIYTCLELSCYAFRMDSGVAQSYEFSHLLLRVIKRAEELSPDEKCRIVDKIKYELRGAALNCAISGYSVECMNLLILCAEDSLEDAIQPVVFNDILDGLRKNLHPHEITGEERLNYFELVSLIYITQTTRLASYRDTLINECVAMLERYDPVIHAETAFLLLDCCSCPHLTDIEKRKLIGAAVKHQYSGQQPASVITDFLQTTSAQTWFFDWNRHRDLGLLLQKKKLRLSY